MPSSDVDAVGDFLHRARTSDAPITEHVTPDGTRYVFRRQPDPHVEEQLEEWRPDGSRRLLDRLFAASGAPPSGYPADLPFVPAHAVSIQIAEPGPTVTMAWERVDDVTALAADLAEACVRAGWTEASPAAAPLRTGLHRLVEWVASTTGTARRFERGERQRLLHGVARHGRAGTVTLVELPLD